jgi:hypothetical protein
MQSAGLFAVVAAVIATLAVSAPLHLVFLLGLPLAIRPLQWEFSGVRADSADLLLLGLALAIVVRQVRTYGPDARVRYFRLWLFLGLILCVAYLHAPLNQAYLTDPARGAYQLYRYCWKLILYYPIAALLFRDLDTVRTAILATVLVADGSAVWALAEGYQGVRASGPFGTGNELGGACIIPMVFCLSELVYPTSHRRRLLYGASALLITRALMFSGSRGAFLATLAGCGCFVSGLLTSRADRAGVARLAMAGLLIGGMVVGARPNVFDRPTVRRLLTVVRPTQVGTFRWRQQERWAYFWPYIMANPWFGTGSTSDPSLGATANTPHNGYLSLALRHGIPGACLFVFFPILGLFNGFRVFARASDRSTRVLGLTIAASLAGVLTHNLVDATLLSPFPAMVVWFLTGTATVLAQGSMLKRTRAGAAIIDSALPQRHLRNAPC